MSEEKWDGVERRKGSDRRESVLEVKKRVNAKYDRLEHRFSTFLFKALIAFAVLGVSCGIALVGFGIVLDQQSDVDDKIQAQRFKTIYEQCLDQNRHHNKAIEQARKVFPENVLVTVAVLINELQPYTPNCKRYTETRVGGI